MRYVVGCLILELLLAACGLGGATSPMAEQAAPASPTVRTDIGEQVSATPQPTVAPTSAPTASPAPATPTAHRLDAKPTTDPQTPAGAQNEVVWHGIRFQYDPQRFRFVEATPSDTEVRAAADLVETPNPCQNSIGTDCTPGDVALRLCSRNGPDFWAWLAQQQVMFSYSPQGDFVDLVLAGHPAVAWPGDGIFFGSRNVYAVPVGEDVLVVGGVGLDSFVKGLQLEHPGAATLAPGQIAVTTSGPWDLWSEAAGGTRVVERPRLYGGALVTILATQSQAVQVRTSEGVTGWIQAAAADALTPQITSLGEQARFTPYSQARIADGYTLPLRESPRSTAAIRGQPAKSGQEFLVMGVRGDWLRVFSSDIGEGWMRWYYDGAQYIEPIDSASSSAEAPWRLAGRIADHTSRLSSRFCSRISCS